MRSKLALCILVAMFCAQAPPPVFAASDLYIPFFTTSGAAPNEGICAVYARSSANGTCTAGNPLFFLIDLMPGAAFTVKNDSGLIITDLHLQIKDPLPAGSQYIIKFKPPPAPAGSIMSVGTTANPAADCGAANVRCINQPDAKWTTPIRIYSINSR
jgi:hypothetical protein